MARTAPNTQPFQQLKAIGFSQPFMDDVNLLLPYVPTSFTLSEQRRIKDHEIKIVATLYYNRAMNILALHSYHLVDVTDAEVVLGQDPNQYEADQLQKRIEKVNWNNPKFSAANKNTFTDLYPLFLKVKEIEDRLKKLPALLSYKNNVAEKLKLKHLHDTAYGNQLGWTNYIATAYMKHFYVLSFHHSTGLPSIEQGCDLLFNKGITNHIPLEAVLSAVKALDLPPKPTPAKIKKQRTIKDSGNNEKKRKA